MDRDSIKELMREVVGPNMEFVDHERWVSFRCPLAPWTHEKGQDKTPSAGISINEDGHSIYNCYACLGRRKGPLSWFVKEYEKYTGENFGELVRSLDTEEFLGGSLPEWGAKKVGRDKVKTLDKQEYFSLFDSAAGHPYVVERGITNRTARKIELLLDDADSHGDTRIVFPVYTHYGELAGFSGRAIEDGVEPRVRDYYGLQKRLLLLGSHLVRPEDPCVVVVEGLFDYAKLIQCGYAGVASMHAGLTDEQIRILLALGLPVVLFFDNDAAGRQAVIDAGEKLVGRLPVSKAVYPKRKGAKRSLAGKDPCALAEEQVEYAVENARIL